MSQENFISAESLLLSQRQTRSHQKKTGMQKRTYPFFIPSKMHVLFFILIQVTCCFFQSLQSAHEGALPAATAPG